MMRSSKKRDSISRASRLHSVHWIVISLSLLLTLMAWHFSKQQIDTQVEAQFQREADQVVELVSERMLKYEDAFWGGVSAIQARGGDISFRDWRVFAKHLRIEAKYPGIQRDRRHSSCAGRQTRVVLGRAKGGPAALRSPPETW